MTLTPVCTTLHTPLRPINYLLYRYEVDADLRATERAGTFNGESCVGMSKPPPPWNNGINVTATSHHDKRAQDLDGNATHQIELVRPVERIRFRRTEYIHVQLFHLFLLGSRTLVRVVRYLGRAGLLGLCLILFLCLRLRPFGGHVARAFYRRIIVVWRCFAFSLAVWGSWLALLPAFITLVRLLGSFLAVPICRRC